MADKRLVITDVDPGSPGYGTMEAVDATVATGIAVPSFNMGVVNPPAGTVVGEGFINTVAKTAAVWDGSTWIPIVPGALVVYDTDAEVIADTNQTEGTYATSKASGNLFVKMSGTGWRQIGVRTYPTVAGLLADTAAPDGSLGVAVDEETFWIMHGGTWYCESIRPFTDMADLIARWPTPPNGSKALEMSEGLDYTYAQGAWRPQSIWVKTEAEIQASADRMEGQLAIASDTGHVYSWHAGQWMSSQVRYYTTETDLLNDTPTDGIIAMAEDTGLVFGRTGGSWRRVNSPTITVAGTAPTTPAAGDIYLDNNTGATTIYDGNKWVNISGTPPPVGEIIMYPHYGAPPGFMLCDGRPIDPNVFPKLYALVGSKTPDLRGQFIRGANGSGDTKGLTRHQNTTRLPRNTFRTAGAGSHVHDIAVGNKGGYHNAVTNYERHQRHCIHK